MEAQSISTSAWGTALAWISQKVPSQRFETWFSPIHPLEAGKGRIVIEVPNPFFIDWFEHHNLPLLKEAITRAFGEELAIQWSVNSNYYKDSPETNSGAVAAAPVDRRPSTTLPIEIKNSLSYHPQADSPLRARLNPRYTFDNFVVGKSNEFPHAACHAAAKDPGRAYNPLFIHGSTGLGKTHLMQALGHQIQQQTPSCRIVYVYCEKFMNELIEAIAQGNTAGFRERYRNLDVLLIDDIHFLAGREATQEEFFHTFNALHDAQKQIVMTSDRPPKEIQNIEQRLISRFHWGLVTDISPPTIETRMAILRRKAIAEGIYLPEDVSLLISSRVISNIRTLEGSLVKLAALSRLLNVEISVDLAQDVLKDVLEPGSTGKLSPEDIQQHVAQVFNVTAESIRGKRRTQQVALARQVAMYLVRRHTSLTLNDIGSSFGHRDHSTVLHACGKIARKRVQDDQLERALQDIEERLTHRPVDNRP
ncbi:MAG: chromosomal replication initiator protein DnaA [Candidatus Eisenbacteria bacterium]|nr:chromosomal replication initiator protein DnaA [Candidatus Eisenbacteria bacterium]MBU1947444.1 chromosomal replication initiator protein DnaA [Candidatus Eisenbacteria bacterium]